MKKNILSKGPVSKLLRHNQSLGHVGQGRDENTGSKFKRINNIFNSCDLQLNAQEGKCEYIKQSHEFFIPRLTAYYIH